MEESPKEAITHTLALAVVAILLILAATLLGSLKLTPPSWMSQSAAAGGTEPLCVMFNGKQICDNTPPTAEESVEDKQSPGECVETSVAGYVLQKRTVNFACVQNGGANTHLLTQTCSPGFEYIVTIQEGMVTVTAKPKTPRPSNCFLTTAPYKCTIGVPLESINNAPGTVSYVAIAQVAGNKKSAEVAGTCGENMNVEDVKDSIANQNLSNLAVGNVLSQFDPKDVPEAVRQIGATNGSNFINNSFEATLAEQKAVVDQAKVKSDATIRSASSVPGAVDAAANELKQAEDKFAEMKTRLATVQKTLADEAAKGPPGGAADSDAIARMLAERDTEWRRVLDTFQKQQQQAQGSQDSGLQQLLQGFMKALQGGGGQGGGQPPPGNQNPQAPGTCQPKLLCSNSTLYSRNTQCVDVPVQQCQYGCSSENACAQAPQQPGQPSAQLSCQPQLADVGMTLAITWGCSAGVSVGSGFTTNGALSGATSTTLAAPPMGTNTVSFGLICTNKGLSASASCNIQVAKPAIVLVANPKSVASGAVSQIGWVTSGMKECTVSSPQQADFTARNATRTNVNGVAESSPITELADFLLTCTTLGGKTRQATTTVSKI